MLSATLIVTRGNDLVDGVQHAGEVRDDLTLEQILDMIVAIATIHGDTGYTEPILQTVCPPRLRFRRRRAGGRLTPRSRIAAAPRGG